MKLFFPLISIQIFPQPYRISFLPLLQLYHQGIYTSTMPDQYFVFIQFMSFFINHFTYPHQLQVILPAWQKPNKSYDLLAAHNTRQPAIFSLYSTRSISFSLSALLSIQFSRYIDRLLAFHTTSYCSSAPSWSVRLPSGAV